MPARPRRYDSAVADDVVARAGWWRGRRTWVIAAAGVEYAFVSLAPPDTAGALERCRRLGAARIVVLPYFLFTGVLPRRVQAQARQWAHGHPDVKVGTAPVLGDCDPLADLAVERYHEALAGDLRMNCDTCLYRVALPGHAHRVGAPQAPHDHPHDHVHAT